MIYLMCVAGILAALVLISVVRALIHKKNLPVGCGYAEYTQDDLLCAQRLAEMVRYKTIAADAGGDPQVFEEYGKKLKALFPAFFKHAQETPIDGAFMWKISGAGGQPPALVLAHSDVVEAAGEWVRPPFAGIIEDGKVHGRGVIDNKGMLCSALHAMDSLLQAGYVPRSDIYFVSTKNEETTGAGAARCREYFEQNGLRFASILDEGGAVTCDAMPGIHNDMAMMGLCEKGYIDVRFTAKSSGGHSASPAKGTPLARLAGFIHYIEKHKIFDTKILPTVRDMFKAVSPHMSFPFRILLGNFWLYGPLLKVLLPVISPSVGSMLKTTMVFTRCEGSTANNVIPTKATAVANIRNLPGESCEEVVGKLARIAERYGLETEILYQKPASSETPAKSEGVQALVNIIEQVFPGTVTAPYMTVGATDCCRLDGLSDNIIRFSPLRSTSDELSAMHGDNERVGIAELGRAVTFFLTYFKCME